MALLSRTRLATLLLFFALMFSGGVYAQPTFLSLKGHLGKDLVDQAQDVIEKASQEKAERLLIDVNSSSGDLGEVVKLAKSIYSLRASRGTKITVYIDDSAIGPAAIVPFLANELYISYFVSWGDIPLGTEGVLPTNILRNTVRSLIPSDHPHYDTLAMMAVAMTDPGVQIVDRDGWKLAKGEAENVVSGEGETLVVNHNQLKKLDLLNGTMTPAEFKAQFSSGTGAEMTSPKPIVEESDAVLKQPVLERLKAHISYSGDANTVGLIQIDDKKSQISQATWIYVKSALDYYRKNKPAFIILELNTPGGEVFSAQKISDALKEMDTQYDVPIVCFINNWAISAGAMLAYSCRFIAVTKDASMGAAEPVIAGEGGQMVSASEKVNSALRADMANRARFFDRDPDIAEAMVDKDIILVKRFGEILKLDSEDQIRRAGPNPDEVISPKGKLLTLNTAEMMRYGVADILLAPAKTGFITEAEREKGKWPADKMLLFKNPFFEEIPDATVDRYQMDWKTLFLAFLSSPVIASVLFLGMLMGFYIEFNSPGFGFPGSIGLMCLAMIILSSYALEIADMLEMILLIIGILFIALDIFLIPTFGILGTVGVVFFIVGLFGLMLPGIGSVEYEFDTQTFNAAGEVFIRRLAWLCGSLVFGVILMAVMGRYLTPNFSGFRRFVLVGSEETKENGYFAGEDPQKLPPPGSKGEAMATLRPSGKVLIGDEIYEAITYEGYIEKGTPIVVDRLEGGVMIVNKVREKESKV